MIASWWRRIFKRRAPVNPLQVRCAWCNRLMRGDKRAPYKAHGVCDDCDAEWVALWAQNDRAAQQREYGR